MNANDLMVEIKSVLEGINGIATIKIGIESNMRPQDYPALRIVSSFNAREEYLNETLSFMVYYGENLQDKIGLEAIYEKLYAYEQEIRLRLDMLQPSLGGLCHWKDTKSDEDRFEGYKMLASRFVVEGV